jgi:hypothetical protein
MQRCSDKKKYLKNRKIHYYISRFKVYKNVLNGYSCFIWKEKFVGMTNGSVPLEKEFPA